MVGQPALLSIPWAVRDTSNALFSMPCRRWLCNRRWEVFHGHNSQEVGSWESHSRNPRMPGCQSFENIQFCLSSMSSTLPDELDSLRKRLESSLKTPQVANAESNTDQGVTCDTSNSIPIPKGTSTAVEECRAQVPVSKEQAESYVCLAHLLSPYRTGVYDEVLALVTMGILSIAPSGIPTLARDWFSRVDILMLDEMHSAWGPKVDPDGLYCVQHKLRRGLEKNWVRTERGWAMADDDPDDLCFDFEELDEWRENFQGTIEAKENHSEGIGRFGL
jgi:hypothetical protein